MTDNNNVLEFGSKTKKEIRKYTTAVIIIATLLVLGGVVINNLFIVQQNEYKIVRQFGDIKRVIQEPGLNYKLPFIQSVSSLPKYNISYDVPSEEINTLDKKRIMVDNYAVWRITDPRLMIANARGSVSIVEGRLGDIIYSNIRTAVSYTHLTLPTKA